MQVSGFAAFLLSITMLAGFALIAGAIALYRRTQDRTKPALMIIMALVLFGNVLIWALP
jgi:hypothetical protein